LAEFIATQKYVKGRLADFGGFRTLLKPTVRIVLFSVIDLGFSQRRIHLGVIADLVERELRFPIVDCSHNLNLCTASRKIALRIRHLVEII
jgi:hypothetical protein